MIYNTLISNLQSPDPLVRVQAVHALVDLSAAALEAISSLLSLTRNETQYPPRSIQPRLVP